MAKRILVVDDEDFMVELLESQLQSLNFEYDAFTDVQEALSFLEQNHETIDLVLIDINMPVYSGIEVAKHVREKNPSLPIILMGGRMGVQVPGYATIEKPFTKAQLRELIQERLRA